MKKVWISIISSKEEGYSQTQQLLSEEFQSAIELGNHNSAANEDETYQPSTPNGISAAVLPVGPPGH